MIRVVDYGLLVFSFGYTAIPRYLYPWTQDRFRDNSVLYDRIIIIITTDYSSRNNLL